MKKVLLVLVVLFLGFWLMTDPSGLADASGSAAGGLWGATEQLFGALIDFVAEVG